MKVQLLTAAILLLGVVAGSAGPNQNSGTGTGDIPGSNPNAGSSGKEDNTGYLTGPNSVLKGDITLRSSTGMQPIWKGTTNQNARSICDPSRQLRVGDHC